MRGRKKSKNKNLRKLEKIKEMELHSKDKEYILNLVQEDIDLLELVNTELLIDKSFMISVIKLNGLALKYASDELKDDEDFVKVALQNSAESELSAIRRSKHHKEKAEKKKKSDKPLWRK